MNKVTISFILTSIIFFVLGYTMSTFLGVKTLVDVNEQVAMNMDHGSHATGNLPHDHSMTEHGTIDLSNTSTPPTVSISIHKDPQSGWNIQIETTNFAFSPEQASLEHVDGQGHAHLYIDGEKITRLYGEWYHLPELSKGEHQIKVSLNGNDHSEFIIDGEVIADTETVIVE